MFRTYDKDLIRGPVRRRRVRPLYPHSATLEQMLRVGGRAPHIHDAAVRRLGVGPRMVLRPSFCSGRLCSPSSRTGRIRESSPSPLQLSCIPRTGALRAGLVLAVRANTRLGRRRLGGACPPCRCPSGSTLPRGMLFAHSSHLAQARSLPVVSSDGDEVVAGTLAACISRDAPLLDMVGVGAPVPDSGLTFRLTGASAVTVHLRDDEAPVGCLRPGEGA